METWNQSPAGSALKSWRVPSMTAAVLMTWCLPVALCNAAEPAPSLRTVLAWQIALERVGFSPGVLDGRVGRKTETALREFQRVRGLSVTGRFDNAAADALHVDADRVIALHVIQPDDWGPIEPPPKDWREKSRRSWLGYESPEVALAEKFHCSKALLAQLNPGRAVNDLKPGDALWVPAVDLAPAISRAESVEIDLEEKIIRVLSRENKLIGLFHCSIAADKTHRPAGETRVAVISERPNYRFDPKMWPEVKDVKEELLIPPGPRNPVGLCWIGLALPHYGIHGTPHPELIGKTGSHGCFRLTNWDALRLGKMVRVGTRVRFISDGGNGRLSSARR